MFCPGKWVMIRQEQIEEKTAGGIIIPEKYRSKNTPFRGEVIEAGKGCEEVRKGDRVLFDREGSFTDVIPHGENQGEFITHVFCHEENVCLVIERQAPRIEDSQY